MKLIDIYVSQPHSLPIYKYNRTGEASSLMTPVIDGHKYPYSAKRADEFLDPYTATYCCCNVSTLELMGYRERS